MSKPAAFQATYSDWKLVRTRKVVQIVFEVPVEAADAAYQVVGGMPNAGEEAWFAIARLNADVCASAREGLALPMASTPPASSSGAGPEARAEDTPKVSAAAPPSLGKCVWEAQGAKRCIGRCQEPRDCTATPTPEKERRRFDTMPLPQQAALLCADPVFKKFLQETEYDGDYITDEVSAAERLRVMCGVSSRSELKPEYASGQTFIIVRERFLAWKMVA